MRSLLAVALVSVSPTQAATALQWPLLRRVMLNTGDTAIVLVAGSGETERTVYPVQIRSMGPDRKLVKRYSMVPASAMVATIPAAVGDRVLMVTGDAVHNVQCARTGECPIVGNRYLLAGRDYNLCETAFLALPEKEKAAFHLIPYPGDDAIPCAVTTAVEQGSDGLNPVPCANPEIGDSATSITIQVDSRDDVTPPGATTDRPTQTRQTRAMTMDPTAGASARNSVRSVRERMARLQTPAPEDGGEEPTSAMPPRPPLSIPTAFAVTSDDGSDGSWSTASSPGGPDQSGGSDGSTDSETSSDEQYHPEDPQEPDRVGTVIAVDAVTLLFTVELTSAILGSGDARQCNHYHHTVGPGDVIVVQPSPNTVIQDTFFTTKDVCEELVKPLTRRSGRSIVDILGAAKATAPANGTSGGDGDGDSNGGSGCHEGPTGSQRWRNHRLVPRSASSC